MDKKNKRLRILRGYFLLFAIIYITGIFIVKYKEWIDPSRMDNIELAETVITEEGNTIVLDKSVKSVASINFHTEVIDAASLPEDEYIDSAAQTTAKVYVVPVTIIVLVIAVILIVVVMRKGKG